jgi:hypothetical protein
MRHVFSGLRACAALFVLLGLVSAPAYAYEPVPFDPPSARILPPGGVVAPEDPTSARIRPPIGVVEEEPPSAIVRPPIGTTSEEDPGLLQLFLRWLEVRILPPVG